MSHADVFGSLPAKATTRHVALGPGEPTGLSTMLTDLPSSVQSLLLNIVLVLLTIYLSNASDHLRGQVHKNPQMKLRWLWRLVTDMPESTIAVVLGMLLGFLLSAGFNVRTKFSEEVFFYFILPPIIFYQGYSLKKRNFFRYFHYIFTLGVLGTLLHMGCIALCLVYFNKAWLALRLPLLGWDDTTKHDAFLGMDDILLLSTVLSSADEVAALAMVNKEEHPKLSALLFGEGVLNDAVSILLFRSVLKGDAESSLYAATILYTALFLLCSSTVIGLAVGLGLSRALKVNTGLNNHPTRQTIIIVLGCYVSYAVAELLEVNGVLSVFVTGVIFSHFAWHSLAPEAKIGTAIFSRALSQIAEIYSFTALGLSVYRFQTTDFSLRYLCISLVGMMLARGVVVFGLFGLAMHFDTQHIFQDAWKDQLVLFGAGLVRGAITWAQALQMPGRNRRVLISTTLQVISVTLVVVGGALPSLLRGLGMGETESLDPGEMSGVAEAVGHSLYDVEADVEADASGARPDLITPLSKCNSLEDARPLLMSQQNSLSSSNGGGGGGGGHGRSQSFSPGQNPLPTLHHSGTNESMVLQGRAHHIWTRIDEALKPYFGGKQRLATPRGSFINNSYLSTETVRAGYGSMDASSSSNGTGNGNGTNNPQDIDPHAMQAAFASFGFKVPKRTLSRLAQEKPHASSFDGEGAMRKSKTMSKAAEAAQPKANSDGKTNGTR